MSIFKVEEFRNAAQFGRIRVPTDSLYLDQITNRRYVTQAIHVHKTIIVMSDSTMIQLFAVPASGTLVSYRLITGMVITQ